MKNTQPFGRRVALGFGVGLGAAALARPALAQRQFPDRPIRVLVPWAPGGTTDVQMRAVCEAASKRLGQPVVVDNKPGAGGILAAQALAGGTRPDGYTLAQMPVSVFRYPQMAPRPPFDPMKDFTWIVQLTGYLFGVAVRAEAPWREFREFPRPCQGQPWQGQQGLGGHRHVDASVRRNVHGNGWHQDAAPALPGRRTRGH